MHCTNSFVFSSFKLNILEKKKRKFQKNNIAQMNIKILWLHNTSNRQSVENKIMDHLEFEPGIYNWLIQCSTKTNNSQWKKLYTDHQGFEPGTLFYLSNALHTELMHQLGKAEDRKLIN